MRPKSGRISFTYTTPIAVRISFANAISRPVSTSRIADKITLPMVFKLRKSFPGKIFLKMHFRV